ncbi:MAG: nitroreductase family deazaflavin-dependent oxidoreductase [Chloroflexota bacterium]
MTDPEAIIDSTVPSVAKHIQRYVETDGKDGYLFHGMPTLLLTTRGRKSGKLYRTALIFGQDGDRYLLIPSNGGADDHPSWYLNLVENPQVEVQVSAEKFSARARTANPEEKPALWKIMTTIFSRYNTYQKQAGREIPVVILERI